MVRTKKLQDQLREIYDKISQELYLCRPDIEVCGEEFNSTLLLGSLTEINRGNMLLFGEYGGGKTTSAEYLNAIFNGLPLDLVKQTAVRGNPQITEEKIIACPDYGAMNSGDSSWTRNPIWTDFVQVGPKIIDEFNRIPEPTQSVLLDGIDRGYWKYLNGFISTGRMPFFATCNYEDRGNNGLIPPILDRFDVAVESKFPGVSNSLCISNDYDNSREDILVNEHLTEKALEILNSRKPYKEVMKGLESIAVEQRNELTRKGFSVLYNSDLEQIREEIGKVRLDRNSEQYLAFLIAEINSCPKYGQKRSIDNPKENKQNGLYLNSTFAGSGSRREEKSIVRYAKSIAWLQNQEEVNLDHIVSIAPYVLWHRIGWTHETTQTFKDDDREDPSDLYIAKKLIGDGTAKIPGVKKRFAESQSNYQRVMNLIRDGKLKEALRKAEEYSANKKGHPIFYDLKKDLS